MSRDRVPTYADRLPPVVPKVEDHIEGMSDELVEILYPGRRQKPFAMTSLGSGASPVTVPTIVIARNGWPFGNVVVGE